MPTARDTEGVYIINQASEVLDQMGQLREKRFDLDYDDPQRVIIQEEIDQYRERFFELMESLSEYRRPNGRISGMFSWMLAPLPSGMKDIAFDDNAKQELKALPSYRWVALGLVFGVIVAIATLSLLFPWLLISPLSVFMDSTSVSSGAQSAVMNVIVVAIGTFLLVAGLMSWQRLQDFTHTTALEEEKWFRSGAESWSWGQRAVSCVAFGACHIVNIIYPAVTLIVLSIAGGAFMWAYLREYKRSHDVTRATLASTRLHAMYNIYAGGFLVVGAIVLIVVAILL